VLVETVLDALRSLCVKQGDGRNGRHHLRRQGDRPEPGTDTRQLRRGDRHGGQGQRAVDQPAQEALRCQGRGLRTTKMMAIRVSKDSTNPPLRNSAGARSRSAGSTPKVSRSKAPGPMDARRGAGPGIDLHQGAAPESGAD